MSRAKELSLPTVTDTGERVLPSSRRPDGTVRRERRIREGYTPQEEVKAYVPRQMQARMGGPVCVGMDDEEVKQLAAAAAAAAAKSKAAKKNEKRKEKKAIDSQGASSSTAADDLTRGMQKLSTNQSSNATAPEASAGDAGAEGGPVTIEKQIRALRKKIRQAEALLEKQQQGQPLTQQEEEKMGKIPSWEAEVKQLEAQL